MEINNISYKLSYDEAVVALAGTTMLQQQEAYALDEDAKRVIRLIANSIATSRMLIGTRLEYNNQVKPGDELIEEACRMMTSNFISLPKDDVTSRILPLAAEDYFWHGHEIKGIVSDEKISAASNMMMQLIFDGAEDSI